MRKKKKEKPQSFFSDQNNRSCCRTFKNQIVVGAHRNGGKEYWCQFKESGGRKQRWNPETEQAKR